MSSEQRETAAAVSEIERATAVIVANLAKLGLHDQIAALNKARSALHDASPFREEPVDLVLWVPGEEVVGNDFNPNAFAPPETVLLRHSILVDHYTQPIVANRVRLAVPKEDGGRLDCSEVVDGFNRHRVGKEVAEVRERLHGYLPVTHINKDRSGRADRMASCVRHNRARGEHKAAAMSDLVRQMYLTGWTDEKIRKELGMDPDELLRLKQVTGLAALFAEGDFTEAWTTTDDHEGER